MVLHECKANGINDSQRDRSKKIYVADIVEGIMSAGGLSIDSSYCVSGVVIHYNTHNMVCV